MICDFLMFITKHLSKLQTTISAIFTIGTN